jgi:hypothetical protein
MRVAINHDLSSVVMDELLKLLIRLDRISEVVFIHLVHCVVEDAVTEDELRAVDIKPNRLWQLLQIPLRSYCQIFGSGCGLERPHFTGDAPLVMVPHDRWDAVLSKELNACVNVPRSITDVAGTKYVIWFSCSQKMDRRSQGAMICVNVSYNANSHTLPLLENHNRKPCRVPPHGQW